MPVRRLPISVMLDTVPMTSSDFAHETSCSSRTRLSETFRPSSGATRFMWDGEGDLGDWALRMMGGGAVMLMVGSSSIDVRDILL